MSTTKRCISLLLALVIVLGLVPWDALVAEAAELGEVIHVTEEPVKLIETEEPTETTAPADEIPVTRAQWLHTLVAVFDYRIEDDIVPDNYFPDLSPDAEYYEDVLTAVYYGLVDVLPNSPLEPEAAATREFVVNTLNTCMGYLPESAPSFAEAGAVTYPDDIQVALEQGWFTLTDGAFLPDVPITAEELALLQTAAEAYVEEFTIVPTESEYTFKEGVIEITEESDISTIDSVDVVTVTNLSKAIVPGDKFVVYSGGLAIPYLAESVTVDGGNTVITTAALSFEDAIDTMLVQQVTDADPANYYAAEDAELIFIEEESGQEYTQQAVMEQLAKGSKKIYIPKYSKTISVGEAAKFKLSVELKNAKICYNVDIGLPKGTAAVWLDTNVEVSGTLSCSLSDVTGEDIEIYIGGYTVPGIGGLSVYIKVDVTGSISVVKKFHMKTGLNLEYDVLKLKGKKNCFFELTDRGSNLNAEISAKICLEAKFGLYGDALPVKGYLYAEGGFKAKVKYTTYSEIEGNCTHFAAYLYAEYGAKVEWSFLGWDDELDWNREAYDEASSPVKLSKHYEDGVYVPGCTRTGMKGTTTGDPSKIADSGYSTGYNSSYFDSGLSSGGSSTGYGSGGEPVIIYTYSLDDKNNATITSYKGNATSLTIPLMLDGYHVTAIGANAFKNNTTIRTVVMQDNILTIGNSAFYGCSNLRNLTLSESLTTIGSNAFENCSSLTTVDIPDTVTSIGEWAFGSCTALQAVTLSKNLVTIGGGAFYNCDALGSIEIPKSLEETTDVYNHDNGWGYRYGVFYGCDGLKNVTFEEGTTQIANGLFARCYGLESIVIPDTVTIVESQAFHLCTGLKNVTLSASLTQIDSSAFDTCTSLESIVIPDTVSSIGTYAFSACSSLREVKLSKGLVTLGGSAFYDCDALASIEIPKSLEETTDVYNHDNGWGYRYGVFYGCDGLKNVTFEEGTTQIANGLFARCYGLESIVIPDTVTSIESQAFHLCTGLKNVTLSASLTQIDSSAFDACTSLESIVIPDTVTSIGTYAFSACSSLREVKLSKGLVTLGGSAFYDCDALASIEIPKSLEETTDVYNHDNGWGYRYGVFYGCDGLKNVAFEEGTTQIANGLFARCYGLESIVIPDTVTSIESQAFYLCTGLKNAVISDSVQSIGNSAFKGANIEIIIIPESVTSISTSVFTDNAALTTVTWPSSLPTIPEYTFSGCTALTTVNLPDNLTAIHKHAFNNCDSLVTFTMPDSVTTMNENVFYDCDALTDIHLSEKLQKINNNTFYNCDALTSITIPYGVTSIGNSAFYDCDALETVDMANSVTSLGTNVFYHNDVLKNVTLSRNLTAIPSGTFKECAELEEIVIPYFTTAIADNAFNSSPKLTKVVVRNKLASISSSAFSYADRTIFYGPTGSYAENWCAENGFKFNENTAAAASVTMEEKNLTLAKGKTHQLNFDIAPVDFADTIVWRTTNANVVTVDEYGKLTAVGTGSATVRINVGSYSASVKVTVTQAVTKLTLNKKTLALDVPNTYQLTAAISPTDATNQVLAWTSSNESAATVDENGLITAVGNGTAVITAATTDGSNLTASCTVTVKDPYNIPVSSIILDHTALSIEAMEAVQLSASVKPDTAANKAVIWSSSDEGIAVVDANGIVTGVAKGTAIITAAAADGFGASAICTVTVTNTAYVVDDPANLESPHNYPLNCTDFWIYTVPGAEHLSVTFDERTYIEDDFDFLEIYDGTGKLVGSYTGGALAGVTVEVPGDTLKLQLRSDDYGTDWGFKVTAVTGPVKKVASGWSGATEWRLTSDGTLTIYGSGNMKNYGYSGGQPWLNKGVEVTSVVIEEGVTGVGSGAFMNLTTLESVVLPETLTKMGEAAFYGSGLTAVEIPASLWTIQPYTFKNCANLTSVKFNEGNLQKISDGAFYGTGLTELVLPDCLDILDVYAFKGCADLTSITIGSGLTELREAVFYGTAIPTITVPEGITKIGPYAFKNCVALETIDLPESLTSVGEASFYACTGLKEIILPDAVTTIGNYAFRKCAAIEELTFGSELTTIGECAFYGCTSLTEIVIPDKVTTIKPYAFKTCTGLTSVTLGSSVATIGEGAFNTCTGLKTIIFPASVTTIGNYAFSGSTGIHTITFVCDAPAIGTGAFKGLKATAYYPTGNSTWTDSVRQNYGGSITWIAD